MLVRVEKNPPWFSSSLSLYCLQDRREERRRRRGERRRREERREERGERR